MHSAAQKGFSTDVFILTTVDEQFRFENSCSLPTPISYYSHSLTLRVLCWLSLGFVMRLSAKRFSDCAHKDDIHAIITNWQGVVETATA